MVETPSAYELVLKRGVVRKSHDCYGDLPEDAPQQSAMPPVVKPQPLPLVNSVPKKVVTVEERKGSKRKRGDSLTPSEAPTANQATSVGSCRETVSGEGLEAVYKGPFYSYSGFANMNRELVFRMVKMGVKVRVEPAQNKVEIGRDEEAAVEQLSMQEVSPEASKIHGMTMPDLMGHKGRKILYTMIESSDGVHKDYAEKLRSADEVWVPSPYLKKILDTVSPGRVRSMPLGVDHEVFRPDGPKMDLPNGTRTFCFLSVFWWSWRKGYDILLRAFAEEFSGSDDVSLLISTKRHDGKPTESVIPEIQAIIKGAKNDNPPSIILHSEQMSKQKMASLYRSCNAFILMSRGEGFGLPYFEAGASGIPVVATNCTGQSSFLDSSNAWMVEPEGYKAEDNGISSRLGKWCRYYEGQKFPVFGRASIDELKRHMRAIYSGEEEASRKALSLRHKILSELTWDAAAERVVRRLREISEGR